MVNCRHNYAIQRALIVFLTVFFRFYPPLIQVFAPRARRVNTVAKVPRVFLSCSVLTHTSISINLWLFWSASDKSLRA